MNFIKRTLYQSLVLSVKAYQRLFMDFHMWGREKIPSGPVIYTSNHIMSFDPFWVLPIFPKPVHFVSGPGYSSKLNAWVLDAFEQINAMPEHSHNVVINALKYLEKGESVAIAPEGDIFDPFQLGRFYPGVALMHLRTQVPIVPFAIVAPKRCLNEYPKLATVVDGRVYRLVLALRGTYCINIGEPWIPDRTEGSETRQAMRITKALKKKIEALVEEVRRDKYWLND